MAGELLTRPWPGTRVAVLGAAFKPESDDIRDSPALNVAGRLHLQGACVTVYDPRAMDNARRLWPTFKYADSVSAACAGAHVVLVLTEWDEFRELDPERLGAIVARRAVVDGRNCLDPARWAAAGWAYRGPGRPSLPDPAVPLRDRQRTDARWSQAPDVGDQAV
jgi:UDPglucose 6-dehydrogenase